MINLTVYSHTDYTDILEIQTDHICNGGKHTLFINKPKNNIDHIVARYDKVIFYNDNDTYASRLLSCLQQINDDYIILTHDIDIIINVCKESISNIINNAYQHNWDRIDLKYTTINRDSILVDGASKSSQLSWCNASTDKLYNDRLYLVKQSDPENYIYNVNPSVWKRKTLIQILENFKDKTYRTIEGPDVQHFCKQYSIYKLFSSNINECGYFQCVNEYVFLHISHGGKLIIPNDKLTTTYGQSYADVSDKYEYIINRYNLTQSDKWKV
jgi:hypothetical protein